MINEKDQQITESKKSFNKLSKENSQLKAKEFISEKIKDLPLVESKKILKKTSGMTFEDVKKSFKTILESVQEEIKEEQKIEDEKPLKEAITDILEEKDNQDKASDNTTNNNSEKDAEGSVSTKDSTSDNEVTGNENGESNEDEPTSVPITESQMVSWIDAFNRFTPNK